MSNLHRVEEAAALSDAGVTSATLQSPYATVLRMALGDVSGAPSNAALWWATYRLAVRERCAGLIWLRCYQHIAHAAPDDLVRQWRTAVLRQHLHSQALLERFDPIARRLVQERIPCAVLKGAPLASHLYGDPLVRPMDDIDLLVPPPFWRRVVRILEEDGWSRELGRAGWSEIYRVEQGEETFRVDLQRSLLVDHLEHLPEIHAIPDKWQFGSWVLPVLTGPAVAVFLALHLLKHQLPPILWLVDFLMFWRGMSSAERCSAFGIATSSRVHRYLQWAVTRSAHLEAAALGDERAARRLGFFRSERRDTYGMIRLVSLAASAADMMAVVGAWAWPRPLRYDWSAFVTMWRRRISKNLSTVYSARRIYLDPQSRSDLAARSAAANLPVCS